MFISPIRIASWKFHPHEPYANENEKNKERKLKKWKLEKSYTIHEGFKFIQCQGVFIP